MIKNIIIALLVGIVIGQFSFAHADNTVATNSTTALSRHDIMEAAALVGLLANSNYYPAGLLGHAFHRPEFFRAKAKDYADAL